MGGAVPDAVKPADTDRYRSAEFLLKKVRWYRISRENLRIWHFVTPGFLRFVQAGFSVSLLNWLTRREEIDVVWCVKSRTLRGVFFGRRWRGDPRPTVDEMFSDQAAARAILALA